MKVLTAVLYIFLPILLFSQIGCEQAKVGSQRQTKADNCLNKQFNYAGYSPDKIDIIPLTEVVAGKEAEEGSKINVYVSLLDSFGCQIKSPAVFRFELYEHLQRSAELKGKRIIIWPDIDLTDAAENNRRWRDFLRAYEFNLDIDRQAGTGFILQITCLCPDGKRLSTEFGLQ